MKEPTLQEVFSKVAGHLLDQGVKALDGIGDCRYRDICEDKLRTCAIGCLIPEELYVPEIEGCTIGGVILYRRDEAPPKDGTKILNNILEELNLARPDVLELLKRLQWIHDDVDTDEWYDELRETAEVYNLEHVR